jgi:arsenate reductase (thioredoxin)
MEFVMTESPARYVHHRHPDLSIDQQLALRTAATRLQRDFSESFGVETIERFLYSSYDQFAGRATVVNFLPLLAERFARQRLHALARVEGKISDGKPTVVFLCTHDAGRSQMALGFFTDLAGDRAVAWSGGSEPGQRPLTRGHDRLRTVNPLVSNTSYKAPRSLQIRVVRARE